MATSEPTVYSSDYVIAQKQDLINIADAIREKTGTTDGMGIDEMAALIAAIESGGGSDGLQIASGEFTLASSISTYTVTHDLGVLPNLFIVYAPVVTALPSNFVSKCIVAFVPEPENTVNQHIAVASFYTKGASSTTSAMPPSQGGRIDQDYSSSSEKATTPYVMSANATSCIFHGVHSSSSYTKLFKAGATYKWLIGKVLV